MTEDIFEKKIKEWNLPGMDRELLKTAFIHPSYDKAKKNNQRLEFLGDALLGMVLAEYLYKVYPEFPEGELTRLRALLAREATLAHVAHELGFMPLFFLGKGEEHDGGREKPSTLADAMEALIAAIYLSLGVDAMRDFVLAHFAGLENAAEVRMLDDYKTLLQEYVQKSGTQNVRYHILAEEGPAHQRLFTAGVFYQGKQIGQGQGRSKQSAEKAAAKEAYALLTAGREHGRKGKV